MNSQSVKADDEMDRRLRPALVSFFARRVRNIAEAEDLAQEVFIRVAQGDGAPIRSMEAYVFQIAANLLRDRARREKVRADYREHILSDAEGAYDPLDPFRIAAGRANLAMLATAIGGLPEKTRRIFVLYRIENIDKNAIATGLGCSVRSVEMHIKLATQTLFDVLEGES